MVVCLLSSNTKLIILNVYQLQRIIPLDALRRKPSLEQMLLLSKESLGLVKHWREFHEFFSQKVIVIFTRWILSHKGYARWINNCLFQYFFKVIDGNIRNLKEENNSIVTQHSYNHITTQLRVILHHLAGTTPNISEGSLHVWVGKKPFFKTWRHVRFTE